MQAIEFLKACKSGETEKVIRILPQVDPAEQDNEAIKLASMKGRIEVVRLLLADNRVDPGAEVNHSIKAASLNGHAEVVQELLKHPRVNPAVCHNRANSMGFRRRSRQSSRSFVERQSRKPGGC